MTHSCATCKDKRRVMKATLKPKWAFTADPAQLAKRTNPLPPFTGRWMFDFTEVDCPDCTEKAWRE